MARYIARRLLIMVPVALLVSAIAFLLLRLVPGDPVRIFLGEESTPEQQVALRHELALDQPIPVQYGVYVAHLVHGDMGRSLRTHQPVAEAIIERLPATLELGLSAILYSLLIALPLGMLAALRRGTGTDLVATSLTLLGVSVPNFFLGIVLILVFGLLLRLLPPGGYVDPAFDLPGNLRSIILPAITLGTAFAAVNMRQIRSALVETLNRDYIRTARAKGLAPAAVLTRHALRNALIPLATLVGIQVALIFEGAIITETIFFWPGIGKLVVDSIGGRDYPVVQGVVIFAALVVLLASLLVDLLYVALDPRIRLTRA